MTRPEIKDRENLSKLLDSLKKEDLIGVVKRLLLDSADVVGSVKGRKEVSEVEVYGFVKRLVLDSIDIVDLIKERKGISDAEIYELARGESFEEKIRLPATIFDNKELSPSETIVKYLKENMGLRYNEIAILLNRDGRNIWTTYRNARLKKKEKFVLKKTNLFVPVRIFKDRGLSILENLTSYLKDNYKISYRKIGKILNRDERTIWTAYHRGKIKRKIGI